MLPSLETLHVRQDGAVAFVAIAAPPMNLLGPELVRDLVTLIREAEADAAVQVLVFASADRDYFIPHVDVTRIKEYRDEAAKLIGEASIGLLFRDSEMFGEMVRHPESQNLLRVAMERGFQTRDAELSLARMLGELN